MKKYEKPTLKLVAMENVVVTSLCDCNISDAVICSNCDHQHDICTGEECTIV